MAALVPIVPFVVVGELPGETWLSNRDAGALGFALTGAGLLAADLLLPIPSSIIGSMLGGRLGFVVGSASAFAGLFVGHMVGYGVGRWIGGGKKRGEISDGPVSALWVFGSRPVPILAEAMTLAAGANQLSIRSFALACAAGDALYALVLAGNGAALLPGDWGGAGLILPMLLPVVAYSAYRWLERDD